MKVLTIILGVLLFNYVVTGQTVDKSFRPIQLSCLLLRCYDNVNCELEPSHRCCTLCPQEQRCYYKGTWYDSGRSFEDSCNSCFCHDGLVRCTMRECLPDLDIGCTHNGTYYAHGSTFKEDCNTCTCNQGTVSCTEMACAPFCQYGGQFYQDGESFKDDCNTCVCRNGFPLCTQMACPPLSVSVCYYNNNGYKEGQSMPSKIPCSQCYCYNGKMVCSQMLCPACVGIIKPGQCCPDCSNSGFLL